MIAALLLSAVLAVAPEPPTPSLTPEQAAALAQSLGLPPGTKITIKDHGSTTTTQHGQSVGAGGSATGQDAKLDMDSTAPSVNLDGQSGIGGAGSHKSAGTGWSPPNNAIRWGLLGLGVLMVLGSGACMYLKMRRPGTVLGLAGGACVAAALVPAIAILFVLAAVVVVAAPYLRAEWQAIKGKQSNEALRAVAEGVDEFGKTNPLSYAELKTKIAAAADAADKAVIKKIKEADGLGSK